jgi:kynureninase
MPRLERLRAAVAALLHAPAGTVALAPSVSTALLVMASSLLARTERRKVLVGRLDFPTVRYQFLSRPDVQVELVESEDGISIPPEAFAERLDGDTALVATTQVYYTTSYLQNVRALAEAAHRHGAKLLVDGYHAVGAVPVDVRELDCDVFVGGCLKFLSGGPGTAFAYCRPELIPELEPLGTGWMATKDFLSFNSDEVVYADDARRFEGGTWPVPSHCVALAALELVLEVGVERICERLRDLGDYMIRRGDQAGLRLRSPRERERRGGFVSFESGEPEVVEQRMREDGIVVDVRPGLVRVSPHWAVGLEELERGIDCLVRHMTS